MSLQKFFSTIYALRIQTHELREKAAKNNDSLTLRLSELTEKLYLKACDTARILIDNIEDDAVRLGLRLHYVNGICWYETALLTSDAKIRQKCRKYIKEGDKI